MKHTEDRRTRKTKAAMKSALAKLLSEKPLSSISVREIAELADINRGTFYLHYRDVYEMVESLEDEVFQKFNEIVISHEATANPDEFFPMLVEMYSLIAENAELTQVLLGKNGNAAFVDKMKLFLKEKCFSNAKNVLGVKDSEEFEFFYNYIITGCIGLCDTWLCGGMKKTPQQMAEFTENLIIKSSAALSL